MDSFIGTGKNPNPNVPDIPLGFGMELAQNPQAMSAFGQLSDERKTSLIKHIQGASTGQEAKDRIAQAISGLTSGQPWTFNL